MSKQILLCMAFLYSSIWATEKASPSHNQNNEPLYEVTVGQGYREDHLKWSISGPQKRPNILSELDFKHIRIYLSTLDLSLCTEKYTAKLHCGYGHVVRGTCCDSDYLRNDRKGEFSKSTSRIPGSYNFDTYCTFGRIVPVYKGITFTPYIGYALYIQKYKIRDGYKTTRRPGLYHQHHQEIIGLKSSYKARWTAPSLGFVVNLPIVSCIHVDLGYTFYYPVTYVGHGYWNLRKHPGPNYTQRARASKSFGQKGEVSCTYNCTDHFEVGVKLEAMYWTAREGTDRWKHRGKTFFHKAQRKSMDYLFTVSYLF